MFKLFHISHQIADFGSCGNGIIDDGEECDCGTQCSPNSCCSPVTCRLKADAQCESGPCCDNCKVRLMHFFFRGKYINVKCLLLLMLQFLPANTICRGATNECDLSEVCNGYTSQCPADIFYKNGSPCPGGYCFNGRCPSRDDQCTGIWGRKASRADPECFRKFNMNGSPSGNCGRTTYGQQYKPCEPA